MTDPIATLLGERERLARAAGRIMERCDELAAISSLPGAVCRTYLTPEHRRCNERVSRWLVDAGLGHRQDQAGNLWGSLKSDRAGAPSLILGSHLDTVADAGKYDGILGVLLGLEAMALLNGAGARFPFHIDLVGFGDEEGTRFGATLLGSRAVAGTWDPAWFALADTDGTTLADALEAFGCDPDSIGRCSRAEDELLGYLEVHIEQGPVLEEQGQSLGVVSGIAGARRYRLTIEGTAGHAGTVPMELRRDALAAAAGAVARVEALARRLGIVATVGQLECRPGSVNVIPGSCRLTVDIRAGDDAELDSAVRQLREELEALMAERGTQLHWEEFHNAAAAHCAGWIREVLGGVLTDMGMSPTTLMSGAGHDAMSLAPVTDIGMLFVRCKGGISHNPAESITREDVADALEALLRTLGALRDGAGRQGPC